MRLIAFALTLGLLLGACGTKGPLYQLPGRPAQTPLFVQAGARLGLVPAPAIPLACRQACTASCANEALSAERPAAACEAQCIEACPSGAAPAHSSIPTK